MKRNWIIIPIIIFLLLALVITLIFSRVSLFNNQNNKQVFISVILKNTDFTNDFWNALRNGVAVAATDYNVRYEIKGPKDEISVEEQIFNVEEAIAKKPDAIVLAAADFNRLVPLAHKIRMQHIQLVTIDSSINSNDPACVISTDNFEAGVKAGNTMMKYLYLHTDSRVVIFSYIKTSSTAIDRENGVRSYLQGKVKIDETLYYLSEEHIAYDLTKELLKKEPLPDGIIALNLPGTTGCARALKESGRFKKIVLIGFDSSAAVIEYLQEGVIRETIVQKPFNMGYLGIKAARELIDGKIVKPFIDTGSESINRENMFLSENQKLLFPVNK